ncbi:MAG: hypothetical protein JRK53_24880 [Deltaproteobacteria bacterium]|nr:hypothetical protein [Deltaproteobacteria bacterium]
MKRHMLFPAIMISALAMSAPAVEAGSAYKAKRETVTDASGVKVVSVKAKAGRLNILGEAGGDEVRASGTAHAPTREALDAVDLKAYRDGDRLVVEVSSRHWVPPTKGHEQKGKSMAEEPAVYLDLKVVVPVGLPVEVESLWGPMDVRHVGGLTIRAERSDITVEDVSGDLRVACGEGEIDARSVTGDAAVSIRNGEIRIAGVTGNVTVGRHPAGELIISDVGGNVVVPAHGRGDMAVSNVAGDLIVDDDEGGDIRYRDIGGRVTRPKSGPPKEVRERQKRKRELREKNAGKP